MMKTTFLILAFSFLLMQHAFCQKMKLVANDKPTNLYRSENDETAQIIIKSRVKDLKVYTNFEATIIQPFDDEFILTIPVTSEMIEYGENKGILTFQSKKYAKLEHMTIIQPNQRQYYNIYIPNKFPLSLSLEYIFSKSSKYGFRLSYGKQIGGFLEYHCGEYSKTGHSIESITEDYNVLKAKKKGYIRQSIIGGLKFGLLYKSIYDTPIGIYTLVGGGYGEYGRQWENPTEIKDNIYFYSDYIKGFNGEVALLFTIGNWLNISYGTDVLFGKGQVSIDYRIGCGLNLNIDKMGHFFKRKQ